MPGMIPVILLSFALFYISFNVNPQIYLIAHTKVSPNFYLMLSDGQNSWFEHHDIQVSSPFDFHWPGLTSCHCREE